MAPQIETTDLQVGAHRLRVLTCGDRSATPVVWLHGSGPGASARSNWEHVLPRMADSWLCVAPDILGFADSEHPDPAPGGMIAYTRARAESVVALLDTLGLEKAHLVGNSMGGMISLTVAQLAPERVGRIVLMGSGGAPYPPTESLLKLITFYADPSVEAMASMLEDFVADPDFFAGRLDQIAADRLVMASRDDVRRSHLATFDLSGGPVRFTPEDLATIRHEALVVHGRDDRMLPLQQGLYLAEHLPNAQLHVLPHAGHWIQIEQPERFLGIVRLFLSEPARI